MHRPSRFPGRVACSVVAVALVLPASACRKSAPAAPASPPAPTLTSISPDSGVRGTTVLATLTGTNFVVGSTQIASTAGLIAAGITSESDTSMTANIIVSLGAPLGDAQVSVTTGTAHSGALPFTVVPAAPTLTDVSPNIGGRGTLVAVTLTGTNFIAGATTVTVAGAGVTTNSVAVTGTTSLSVNFVIAAGATLGADSVTVTTAGGTSAAQPFTVETSPLTRAMPKRS